MYVIRVTFSVRIPCTSVVNKQKMYVNACAVQGHTCMALQLRLHHCSIVAVLWTWWQNDLIVDQ